MGMEEEMDRCAAYSHMKLVHGAGVAAGAGMHRFCAFWYGCCLTNTRPNAPQPEDIMILCGSVEELHSITGRSVVIVMMVAAAISV